MRLFPLWVQSSSMNSGELATDPGALKHIEVEHPTRFPGQSTNSKHRTLLEAILLISLQRAKVSGSRADTRRYENKHTSAERLARRATPARVGIVRTRMEAKSDRGSPRDHRRSGEPMDQVPALLARGAEAFGFRGQVWTAARVAQVIKREFGVSYHPTHCSRLLSAIKHSRQKPETRASQRDEQAIQVWRDHHSLEVKKRPKRKNARSCL